MQHHLASATEGQPGRCHDDGHGRVPQPDDGALEAPYHQVDLLPVPFLGFEQHHHQVRAGAEVRRVVTHDQSVEPLCRLSNAADQHLDRVIADGVQLRVEFHREYTILKVHQAGARPSLHDPLPLFRRGENLQVGAGRGQRGAAQASRRGRPWVEPGPFAGGGGQVGRVWVGATGGQHRVEPDGVE